MRQRRKLSKVTDPRGRLDVAAYRIAERILSQVESQRGLRGLVENLLPVVEEAILDTLPGRNLVDEIPQELQAILHVYMQNARLL